MNMQSDQINELAEALSKAQGVISGALKDSSNPFFKSSYADLHSVMACAREPLAANGLSVVQPTAVIDGQLCLITMIMHKSGQWLKSVVPLILVKQDPQSVGSAITYYRRYSYSALVGIAQMDDDGESAMERKPKPETVQAKAPPADLAVPTSSDLLYALAKIGVNVDLSVLDKFVITFAAEKGKSTAAIIKSAMMSPEQLKKINDHLQAFIGVPLAKV